MFSGLIQALYIGCIGLKDTYSVHCSMYTLSLQPTYEYYVYMYKVYRCANLDVMLSNSHRQCEVLKCPVEHKDQPPRCFPMLSNSHRQCEALKKRKDQPLSPTSDDNEVQLRIDSPRKGPMSGVMTPTLEQRRAELGTRISSTIIPRVAGSNKPKDAPQPKVNTAPTVPQE